MMKNMLKLLCGAVILMQATISNGQQQESFVIEQAVVEGGQSLLVLFTEPQEAGVCGDLKGLFYEIVIGQIHRNLSISLICGQTLTIKQ